ncbi:MAG: hypothetical protein LBN93_08750 [Candidatus Symbiothrix sp.]|nr:hypothetical protein [Candidatus Symbiothrix sp.]
MFQDWKKKIKDNPQAVSKQLLWDVDYDTFDFQKGRRLVVRRVIERGWENDYYAAFNLYGGPKGVREIIKEIPGQLHPKDETFVRTVFNLKKEDLQCYTKKQLKAKHLTS